MDQNGSPHILAFEMLQDLPAVHHQRDLIRRLTSISKIEHDMGLASSLTFAQGVIQSLSSDHGSWLPWPI
jgi:hypothetical protein